MKINRTFSIDLSLYTQLTKTNNQSKTVCSALRNYFDRDPGNLTILDASTKQLVAALSQRPEIDSTLMIILSEVLKNGL